MKAIKKILATLMCLCLIIGCVSMTAFAEETATGSITIQSTADVSIAGRTFYLFKVFGATKSTSADGREIVAYDWDDSTKADYETVFFGDNSIIGMTSGTIHDVADYLRSLDGNNSEFSEFATNLYQRIMANNNLKTSYTTHSANASTLTIDDLDLGYYLIYDATELQGNKVRSAIMLTTPGENKTVTIKADLPTINKTVLGNDGVEQKGTSATIGDYVQFYIRGTMPDHSNYSETDGYTYIIEDTLPEGLTFIDEADHKFVVSVNGKELEKGVDYNFEINSENKIFKVTLKDAISYAADSNVVVSYHTTVNALADNKNINQVSLTYSADPTDPTKLGTATSEASVYLYQLVLTKYAEHTDGSISATRLAGAQFNLYEKSTGDIIKFEKEQATNANGQTYYYYRVDPNGTVTVLDTINDESYGASNTINGGGFADVMIFGLAEGDYELDEITAPDGYVVPNYRFEISVKDDIGKTSGIITKLELTTTTVDNGKTGGSIVNAGFKIDEYAIWASITNATGSALPETGGMGTTLFTIVGIVLMAGAVAFFTSRKRSSVA